MFHLVKFYPVGDMQLIWDHDFGKYRQPSTHFGVIVRVIYSPAIFCLEPTSALAIYMFLYASREKVFLGVVVCIFCNLDNKVILSNVFPAQLSILIGKLSVIIP